MGADGYDGGAGKRLPRQGGGSIAALKHIASCSFGKDSLATILLALEHGEPLDEAVYCEVMFDKTISGEVPLTGWMK